MNLSKQILNNLKEGSIPKTRQTMATPKMIKYIKEKLKDIGATLKTKNGEKIISYLGRDFLLTFDYRGRSPEDYTIGSYTIKIKNPRTKKDFAVTFDPRDRREVIEGYLDSIVNKVSEMVLPYRTNKNHFYLGNPELNRIKFEYNKYIEDLDSKLKETTDEQEIANLESQYYSFRQYVEVNYPELYKDFKKIL